MAHQLFYILLSVILISVVSLLGILFLGKKEKRFEKFLMILVAFAAGSMLATAFFDLIPESFENLQNYNFVVIGLVSFFILESAIHWHHSHKETCEGCLHPVVYLNLLGDGMHNFIDGIIVASGFLVSIPSGIAISIAIIFHEIPQEIGDYAILIQGGLTKTKALAFNFLSAGFAIIGALAGYFFLTKIESSVPYAIAIAAGGFIYIAVSDLFPELHKEKNYPKNILEIISLILGIILVGWIVL